MLNVVEKNLSMLLIISSRKYQREYLEFFTVKTNMCRGLKRVQRNIYNAEITTLIRFRILPDVGHSLLIQ